MLRIVLFLHALPLLNLRMFSEGFSSNASLLGSLFRLPDSLRLEDLVIQVQVLRTQDGLAGSRISDTDRGSEAKF